MQQIELTALIVNRFFSANRIKNSPLNTPVTRQNRNQWAVVLKAQGRTVYHTQYGEIVSDASHPVILPRGCTYNWECTAAGECLVVEFDCTESSDEIFGFSVGDNRYMQNIFVNIEHESQFQESCNTLKIIRDLYELLIFLSNSRERPYMPKRRVERLQPVVCYIADHYREPGITNDDLASLCGISTPYFRKLFTQCFHMAPITYLNTFRMNKARQLLQSDYGSVALVAESVGYNSIYHFSKEFRRNTGVSPTEYVQKMRRSQNDNTDV